MREGRRTGGQNVMAAAAVAAGAAASGALACERAPGSSAAAEVRFDTVAGVVHVISGARGLWTEGDAWTIADTGVVVGALDGPAEYVLGKVAGVVVDDSGRLWVADTQAREIRIFDRGGAFLRRVGRDGEGPGEFRNLSGLALAPDGVGALDGTLGRMTVFGPSGEIVRSFRLARGYMVLEHGAAIGFDGVGRFYDRAHFATRAERDSIAVVTYSAAGEPVDTAVVAALESDPLMLYRNGRPYMAVPRPFSPQPALAFGPDGTIHFTRGDPYRIDLIASAGDTMRVLRRSAPPRPVTEAQRAAALDRVEEWFADAGARADRHIQLPATHPAIHGLRVDRAGHVWVLTHVEPDSARMTWSIHDPDGRYLGDLPMPLMHVMDIGPHHVAGVATDELGVGRVRVLPLDRRLRTR